MERRLIRERDILEASTKFLRAKVALQTAFTPEDPISTESIKGTPQGESKETSDKDDPKENSDPGPDEKP